MQRHRPPLLASAMPTTCLQPPHLAKAELAYVVRHVKLLCREGHQIVHVHVALLKGFARCKVEVPCHLLERRVCQSSNAHSKMLRQQSCVRPSLTQVSRLTLFTDSVPHIWQPSPCWSCTPARCHLSYSILSRTAYANASADAMHLGAFASHLQLREEALLLTLCNALGIVEPPAPPPICLPHLYTWTCMPQGA